MRFQDALVDQFFTFMKTDSDVRYYTNLLNIAYTLVNSAKTPNKQLVRGLNFVRDNTTEDLLLPIAQAEELYRKYRRADIDAEGNFNIEYRTRTNLLKEITIIELKAELTKAARKIMDIFGKEAVKYNFQNEVQQ